MTTPLRCVIDTSVCIKHFIADPLTPKVNQLLVHLADPQAEFFVPDLFYVESANTFCKYVRANLYTPEEVQTDLFTLKQFPFKSIPNADLMADAVNISITYNISAYDASYVALSQQVQDPLLILDERLVRTLTNTPYHVISFKIFTVPPYTSF